MRKRDKKRKKSNGKEDGMLKKKEKESSKEQQHAIICFAVLPRRSETAERQKKGKKQEVRGKKVVKNWSRGEETRCVKETAGKRITWKG